MTSRQTRSGWCSAIGAERRRPVDGLDHVVALVAQELAQQRQVRRLVVDREDQRSLAAHGRKPATLSAKVAKSIGLLR